MDKLKMKSRSIQSLSIKKTFFLIVAVTSVMVILLSVISVRVCSSIRGQILLSHAFVMPPVVIDPKGDGSFTVDTKEAGTTDGEAGYTDRELMVCRVTEILIIILPVLFLLVGIGCASSVFYHVKLKEPLAVLKQGISHIADYDLSFTISCQKQDELGLLCGAFEKMRQELLDNNRRMWALAEERKKINASISHDLRTPITVIKGYSEYLERNIGKDVLTVDGTHLDVRGCLQVRYRVVRRPGYLCHSAGTAFLTVFFNRKRYRCLHRYHTGRCYQ